MYTINIPSKVNTIRIQWSLTLVMIFIVTISRAQVISVFRSSPATGWEKNIPAGSSVAFPSVAAGPSTVQFTIRNTGSSTLNLTGNPIVSVTGAQANMFFVTQPAASALAPNASTTFTVTYTPADSLQHAAQLIILNNSLISPFAITVNGAGKILFGAQFPPPGSFTYTFNQSGNIGRPGGWNILLSSVVLGVNTATWWGANITTAGDLQIQLSMNGPGYTNDENFTFSPDESSLTNGSLVWRGNTILNTVGGNVFVYLKCMLTTTKTGGTPYPLVNPATLGISEEVGGLVHFSSLSDVLNANFIILASADNVTFNPYLDFYDNYPMKTCGVCAYVSLYEGFYWKDLKPQLTANNGLVLDEGATAVLGTASLSATDAEDMPAYPERLVFNFMTNPPGPLAFGNGTLYKSGVPMTLSTTFTLQDLQNNLISYTHNGSETTHDEFQFSLTDGNGVLARDGIYTVFTFPITINPVNDPPLTRDTLFATSYAIPITKTLVASDPDGPGLTFSIVSPPNYGTIAAFNPNTGQFTYTPTASLPQVDAFTYRAHDGTTFGNTSTVTVNLFNAPPTTSNVMVTTREEVNVNGTLTGTDPEGGALTFLMIKSPSKGTAAVFSNGSFMYAPAAGKMGGDYFTFKAQDPPGNLSAEDTVFVQIIPRLDPGDILVADAGNLRIFDPVTSQDTVLSHNGLLAQSLNLAFSQGTSIFVFDASSGLLKINPVTGAQSLLAPKTGFSTGGPGGPTGLILDNLGKLIIADGPNGIVKVDSTTGVITTLFSGGFLSYPMAAVYLNNGDLIVADAGVLTGGGNRIIRITPAGVQSTVALGGFLTAPVDLAVVDQNNIVVVDAGSFLGGTDRVLKIDLISGGQTVLSSGGLLSAPAGIDYQQNKLYVVNNSGSKKLLEINYATGVQTDITTEPMVQPWGLDIVPSGVPTSKNIQNVVINNNESDCYNATQVITVAGGGSTFVVMSGGSATMIAGQKILYEPGTMLLNGGYLHGYIAPTGPWCYTPSAPVNLTGEEETAADSGNSRHFSVFPNPTAGSFRVALMEETAGAHCSFELYSMRGERILEGGLNVNRTNEFTISEKPAGLYILRIKSESEIETLRLVKLN